MAAMKHYETAPEDRISLPHKLIYGFGAFVNNLLAAAIGGMVIVLNLGLGMNPFLVGLIAAIDAACHRSYYGTLIGVAILPANTEFCTNA